MKKSNLFPLALYLSFGFVFAAIFNGPVISASDTWFWAWLIGWPVIISLVVLKWLGIIFAGMLGVALFIGILVAVFGRN